MSLEDRVAELEHRTNRYRNALVLLVVGICAVAVIGATTDDVQDMIKTRQLLVVNEAGQALISAGQGFTEHGYFTIRSKHGEIVIEAGVDRNGNGSMGVNVAPHSTLGRRKAAEIGVTDAGDGYFSAFSGDGRTLMYAGASASGNGMLEIMSDAGERLIYAGASNSGDGFLLEGFNKTGDAVVQMYADDYGHGVVGAYDRKGQGRTLKPGP